VAERPSRWQRAKTDSRGFGPRWRDILSLLVGGGLGAGALALFEVDAPAIQQVIVVIAAAVSALLIVPGVEFGLNYVRAPKRQLIEDVIAIRERVESLGSTSRPDPTAAADAARERSQQEQREFRAAARELREELVDNQELIERKNNEVKAKMEAAPGDDYANHSYRLTFRYDGWLRLRDMLLNHEAPEPYRAAYDAYRRLRLMEDSQGAEDYIPFTAQRRDLMHTAHRQVASAIAVLDRTESSS
jgi:hypothetical protein